MKFRDSRIQLPLTHFDESQVEVTTRIDRFDREAVLELASGSFGISLLLQCDAQVVVGIQEFRICLERHPVTCDCTVQITLKSHNLCQVVMCPS